MKIVTVDILGVTAYREELVFSLGWEDEDGEGGILEFGQALVGGKIRVDTELMGKEFVLTVLQALGEQSEVTS